MKEFAHLITEEENSEKEAKVEKCRKIEETKLRDARRTKELKAQRRRFWGQVEVEEKPQNVDADKKIETTDRKGDDAVEKSIKVDNEPRKN